MQGYLGTFIIREGVMVRRAVVLLAVFLVLSIQQHVSGRAVTPVFVDQSATSGLNNGTSWTNAYTNLQSALPGTSGDLVFVAEGTYLPGADD